MEDAHTGEKLIGATVYFPKLQVKPSTNNMDFTVLLTAKDTMSLMVTYVSYSPMSIPLKDDVNKQMNIKLSPIYFAGSGNHGPASSSLQEQTKMSKVGMLVAQVKAMPRMLGRNRCARAITGHAGKWAGGMEGYQWYPCALAVLIRT